MFCFGFYFIHTNVFNAIVQAEEVIILKNDLINEVIDFKKYENISENWNKKNEIINIEKTTIKDPFNVITTTSTI